MTWTGDLMFRLGIKVQGRPLVRLITVGARSGKLRKSVLGSFPDEGSAESLVVVASNNGSARHPGWAYNLVKNPEATRVDLGEGELAVDVEVLTGTERESMWRRVVELAPGYRRYETKTDREIPLFRLTPRGPAETA